MHQVEAVADDLHLDHRLQHVAVKVGGSVAAGGQAHHPIRKREVERVVIDLHHVCHVHVDVERHDVGQGCAPEVERDAGLGVLGGEVEGAAHDLRHKALVKGETIFDQGRAPAVPSVCHRPPWLPP